jgi:hypothetical protein
VTAYARSRRKEAERSIQGVLYMSNITKKDYTTAVNKIKSHARVALHFHPDRPDPSMKSVAEALFEQGKYKSQFETLLSNGGLSAYPGGDRDLWEKGIFGEAYHQRGVTDCQRPKYGALNLMLHPDGASPRFGSCYFLLSPEVSHRCTYTYGDSHQNPKEKGTYEMFDDIMAALFTDALHQNFALGEYDLTPPKVIDHFLNNLEKPFSDPSHKKPMRNLNHYIEAQVHGDILLSNDIEVLVADPSFKGTHTGRILEQICSKYSIELFWHMGFTLSVDEVPEDFRGPAMPSMAKRIAKKNKYIHASIIGSAAFDYKKNPSSWENTSKIGVLQELKYLWHVLVKFGHPHRHID